MSMETAQQGVDAPSVDTTASRLGEATDWVLNEDNPGDSEVYPADALDKTERAYYAEQLLRECRSWADEGYIDFRVVLEGYPFRVSVQYPQSGRRFFVRALARHVEPLQPGAQIRKGFVQQLRSPTLNAGGLVLVSGPPGCGKSTTVARTVAARLRDNGGVAWCLENPIEFLLEGQHGNGVCWQREVEQGGYGQAMREVMRCYPVGEPGILTVGEVRDQETADSCLKAATNGLLVIATLHAPSIEMTVDRILNMSSGNHREAFRASLAATLKLVVYQRRQRNTGMVGFKSLWVSQPSNAYTAIRSGKTDLLTNDVQYQANRMKSGDPVC